jgi:hypothetical protein
MVTKILSGQSIRGLLNYNEQKVTEGLASLVMASRFGTELDKLDFKAKLTRFEHLTSMNSRAKTNALHVMLNFDRDDKPDVNTLQQIAAAYMEKIGFGDQPYLVYQHKDVSHPHLHIVTTNVQADGNRISIHNIGKTLSETARRELEIEYKLVKADGRKKSEVLAITPADPEKVFYGKTPTKRAINNVVAAIMRSYKFTSLAEYNAVLKQFNVIADRGKEDTVMFEKRGLVYAITDERGKRVGIPFKASVLSGKPTLNVVEKKFEQNKERRKPYKEPLKEAIDKVFQKYAAISKATLIAELVRQNINVAFRQNEQGYTYGITYIDHRHKTVFNGSDLGKAYSAKAITERLGTEDKLLKPEQQTYLKPPATTSYLKKEQPAKTYLKAPEPTQYLKGMLSKTTTDYSTGIPHKKKRKKKGQVQEPQQSL